MIGLVSPHFPPFPLALSPYHPVTSLSAHAMDVVKVELFCDICDEHLSRHDQPEVKDTMIIVKYSVRDVFPRVAQS